MDRSNFKSNVLLDEEDKLYSEESLSFIDLNRVPHHVAIIMDGNRRWALKNGLPCMAGHWMGAEVITNIISAASELGIKVVTVFAFSTENWIRNKDEVEGLMHLFRTYLLDKRDYMVKKGVKLDTIGDCCKLPEAVQEVLAETKEATNAGDKIQFVLALNYGGRDDIRRAVLNILEDCNSGKFLKKEISERLISQYLDSSKWEDPQLLIRTSGEQRLSNFLLWQISYSEIYISDVLWPDFTEKDLLKAVVEYQKRQRRLGGS